MMRDTNELNHLKITFKLLKLCSQGQSKPILLPHRINIITIYSVILNVAAVLGLHNLLLRP